MRPRAMDFMYMDTSSYGGYMFILVHLPGDGHRRAISSSDFKQLRVDIFRRRITGKISSQNDTHWGRRHADWKSLPSTRSTSYVLPRPCNLLTAFRKCGSQNFGGIAEKNSTKRTSFELLPIGIHLADIKDVFEQDSTRHYIYTELP